MRVSKRAMFAILAFCCFLSVALALGILSSLGFATAATKVQAQEAERCAAVMAGALNDHLQAIADRARIYASRPPLSSLDIQASLEYLAGEFGRRQASEAELEGFVIVLADGRSYSTDGSSGDFSLRPFVKACLTDPGVRMSPPIFPKGRNQALCYLAVPVFSRDSCKALLLSALSLKALGTGLAPYQDKDNCVFICDGEATLVYHPDASLILSYNLLRQNDALHQDIQALGSAMKKGESGSLSYQVDSLERIGAYAPIPLAGWALGYVKSLSSLHPLALNSALSLLRAMGITLACFIPFILYSIALIRGSSFDIAPAQGIGQDQGPTKASPEPIPSPLPSSQAAVAQAAMPLIQSRKKKRGSSPRKRRPSQGGGPRRPI